MSCCFSYGRYLLEGFKVLIQYVQERIFFNYMIFEIQFLTKLSLKEIEQFFSLNKYIFFAIALILWEFQLYKS